MTVRQKTITAGGRMKYLSRWEINKILKRAKKDDYELYCILLMSYLHGLRSSEILRLRWSNIDFTDNKVYIIRSKGSLSGSQRLSPAELQALQGLKRTGQTLFKMHRATLDRKIKELFKLCGIPADKRHHHILKHTCAIHLLEQGVDIFTVKNLLGHKDIRNTIIYTKHYNIDVDKALQGLGHIIGGEEWKK